MTTKDQTLHSVISYIYSAEALEIKRRLCGAARHASTVLYGKEEHFVHYTLLYCVHRAVVPKEAPEAVHENFHNIHLGASAIKHVARWKFL